MKLLRGSLLILGCSLIILSISCDTAGVTADEGQPPKDADGNAYVTISALSQEWFAENLRTTKFNDGTPIDQVMDLAEWSSLDGPAFSYYDNDPDNAETYGILYNGYAVAQENLCPKGWRIASDEDYKKLEIVLGMSQDEANNSFWRGTNEGSKLAIFKDLWVDGVLENDSQFGTSGFNGTPGGYRGDDGVFYYLGTHGYWWTSTEDTPGFLWSRGIFNEDTRIARYSNNLKTGYCVRCIRDF
ncbi:MAG: fibrobacter succinogenes major paralogous domain-containing protein [Bacteroidota bacterium]